MKTFYDRLLQIVENKGFKTLNAFALNGLEYDSSSKLSRLKDENKKPSVEILEDIANKFEDVNLNWLITGKGEMLHILEEKRGMSINVASDPGDAYLTKTDELLETQRELIKLQKEKIAELELALDRLQDADKV